MLFDCFSAWRIWVSAAFLGIAAASGAGIGKAEAQIGPQAVSLIDRLCAQTLRTNEEDRLYGMISLTVRATIRYRGSQFQPDVIDDAVQDSLDAMIEDCPELTEADASKRLTMAVEIISDATSKVLEDVKAAQKSGDKDNPYNKPSLEKVTAADLSQELSSQEIDQWLESLPPRQRALTLFLYASDVTPKDIAAAVGEPPGALTRQFGASKADLLRIFHEEFSEPPPASRAAPGIVIRESGDGFAAVMKAAELPAASPPPAPTAGAAEDDPPAAAPPTAKPAVDGGLGSLRVTGISDDLYAGWSLLATAQNLPRGQRMAINEPFVLEPNNAGMRRMLVTNIAEIGDPNAPTRRFLLKAYAIDAEKEAAGLRDSFHVGAPLANEEAKKTLANPNLSSIEVARCLWHDFGTGQDPGLCRQ
jgi:DNA-directed RNA polymerase specialized sigma24 family protein